MMKTREKRFTKKRQEVFHVGGRRAALLLALALGRLALQGAEGYPVMDNDRILLMNNDAKGGGVHHAPRLLRHEYVGQDVLGP